MFCMIYCCTSFPGLDLHDTDHHAQHTTMPTEIYLSDLHDLYDLYDLDRDLYALYDLDRDLCDHYDLDRDLVRCVNNCDKSHM